MRDAIKIGVIADQTGALSGPACVTSGRTVPSATFTIEISAVPPLALSLLI